MICTLLLQMGTNLANDYYDFVRQIDTSERIGPVRMSASGTMPPRTVKRSFQFCLLSALLLGIFLVWKTNAHPLLLGVGLLCIFFAWAYSGGPLPLSHYAMGEVTALIMFGPIAVWGTAALQLGNDLSSSLLAFYWGLGPGLIATSMMALNNFRDLRSDKIAGKTTLATLMGEGKARLLVLIPILIASMIPLIGAWMTGHPPLILVSLLPILFLPVWKHIYQQAVDERLNRCLEKIGMFLALYCLGLSTALSL